MSKVFSAPKALIEIDGVIAGYIQNLTWSENIGRSPVRGIGSLYKKEFPAITADCSWSANFFFLSLKDEVIKKVMNREATIEEVKNTISLDEFTFSIVVYKKTISSSDKSVKLITGVDPRGETIVKLADCLINRQNWTLAEGGLASISVDGEYLTPVTVS